MFKLSNKNTVRSFANLLVILAINYPLFATVKFIGLAPTPTSMGRAEAMLSFGDGNDALFYNPALLSFQSLQIKLMGLELGGDINDLTSPWELPANTGDNTDNINADNKKVSLTGDINTNLENFVKNFESGDPIQIETTVRALDIGIPHMHTASFARQKIFSLVQKQEGIFQLETTGDIGLIGGVALSYKRFSIGLAKYYLTRLSILSTPNQNQLDLAVAAANNGTLEQNPQLISEFTEVKYGGTTGSNLGFLYRFSENYSSSIALAILNFGGAKFKNHTPIANEKFLQAERQFKEQATIYQINMKIPDPLPEMVNVGINWGGCAGKEDFFCSTIALEGHDIASDYLPHKWVASGIVLLKLPDHLAVTSAIPIWKKDGEAQYHIGISGLRLFAGIRPNEYSSQGGGLDFHLGYANIFSFMKLNIAASRITPLVETPGQVSTLESVQVDMKLTLMF